MATQEYSREAEDRYEVENDNSVDVSGDIKDSSYVHPETKSHLPIQSDDAPVDDPIDVSTSNTDQQLAQDDADAIDQSNIIGSRTRGAKPSATGYSEGPDEDDIPQEAEDTGRSSTR